MGRRTTVLPAVAVELLLGLVWLVWYLLGHPCLQRANGKACASHPMVAMLLR
jgi:hypothetical protein